MKVIFRSLMAIVALGAVLLAPFARAQAPEALLLSCTGGVTVRRAAGATVAGSYGLALHTGDEVRTGPGAEAEIHFQNGTWVTIGASSTLVVRAARMPAPAKEAPSAGETFASMQSFLTLKDAEGVSTLAALRSGGGAAEINLEGPCRTAVRGGHPRFRWSAADASMELRLKLYDEAGLRWQTDVTGMSAVEYPSTEPPLEPGTTYSWILETTDPLRIPPVRTPAGFFEVLPAAEEQSLVSLLAAAEAERAPSESARHIVRASAFFRYRLFDDAVTETRLAIEADPDNTALRTILARLYGETGRTAEALQEYNRLIERR
jgi:hypothetical protein